jgi:hypothetical protein
VSDVATAPASAIAETAGKTRRKKLPERTLFVLMNLTPSRDAQMVASAAGKHTIFRRIPSSGIAPPRGMRASYLASMLIF